MPVLSYLLVVVLYDAAEVGSAEVGLGAFDGVDGYIQFLCVFPDEVPFEVNGYLQDEVGLVLFDHGEGCLIGAGVAAELEISGGCNFSYQALGGGGVVVVHDGDGNVFYRIIGRQGKQDELDDGCNDQHADDAFIAEYLSEFFFQ